jgi:hypothetical protein
MKPLFIPLKRQFFEEFASGIKKTEYRQYGPRWNEKVCKPGRLVTLSLGYGKQNRMRGVIKAFSKSVVPTRSVAWKECYGDKSGVAACITIQLDHLP